MSPLSMKHADCAIFFILLSLYQARTKLKLLQNLYLHEGVNALVRENIYKLKNKMLLFVQAFDRKKKLKINHTFKTKELEI